jgi:N-acetylmuramic acid 6-phosphate etherase
MKKNEIASLYTEKPNPRSRHLDSLPTKEILILMNQEDALVPKAVKSIIPLLSCFVEEAVKRMQLGGRLFYVGAGTSGRLGILDAAECPPTFGTKPTLVQGILAGGRKAIFHAVEKAEDNKEAGADVLKKKKLSSKDCVVGLSASGRTPFVLGALQYAQKQNALTAGITCNPKAQLVSICQYPLVANVGPEIIAGSTRLKCGTAQKLILNMISTSIMVKLGKVKGNRMIDLIPKSQKLWERAKHLVMQELHIGEKKAEALLKESRGSARKAIELGKR